ncbi:unnamed protein product [Gongylonema pulchrum]|uniref:C2H2-type domain-containing protein n=1 Tax=Gongylonema pulchrum TaxID=637853 RepID=A0A183EFP7_9BILA|nr:unnamed protein product [Gongylonema pulchrum]
MLNLAPATNRVNRTDDDAGLLLTADAHHSEDASKAECEMNGDRKKSKRQKRRELKREKENEEEEEEEEKFDSNGEYRDIVIEGAPASSSKNEMHAEKVENAEDGEEAGGSNTCLEIPTQQDDSPAPTKARRRKEKQPTTAANTAAEDRGPKVGTCDRCGEVFESRTKLFTHLKESGHATLKVPAAGAKLKPNKRKNK